MGVGESADRDLSDLRFALDKSIRYHQRRRGFFETAHRAVMFCVVLAGSGAAFQLFDAKFLAVIAALLGTFDLAYSPGSRARDHIILHQQFSTLLATVLRKAAPTDQDFRDWSAERLRIEADEPPIFWALEKDCHNEICFARGRASPEYLNTLTWRERMFMQFFRFDVVTPRV